jgi:hypothetical protein
MSRGRLGDFADDPRSIFVDLPQNPAWVTILDVLITAGALGGGYLAAGALGASRGVAILAAVVAACVFGLKLSLFFKLRQIPRLGVEEFDAIRGAGSRALAEFRAAHPELSQVGWSLVGSTPGAHVIAVYGAESPRIIAAQQTYAVQRDGSISIASAASYPRTGYSQRLERPAGEENR